VPMLRRRANDFSTSRLMNILGNRFRRELDALSFSRRSYRAIRWGTRADETTHQQHSDADAARTDEIALIWLGPGIATLNSERWFLVTVTLKGAESR